MINSTHSWMNTNTYEQQNEYSIGRIIQKSDRDVDQGITKEPKINETKKTNKTNSFLGNQSLKMIESFSLCVRKDTTL